MLTERQTFLAVRELRARAAALKTENDALAKKFAGVPMPAQFKQGFDARAEEIEAFTAAATSIDANGA